MRVCSTLNLASPWRPWSWLMTRDFPAGLLDGLRWRAP